MGFIKRTSELEYLNKFRDKKIIKVVTGVRRCGKSVLLNLYADELKASGVVKERIISINLEDYNFHDLREPKALYNYVTHRLRPEVMNYVFLDEIQHVADYADVVDALYIKDNVDLYVTGSNAYMLSSEIATLLSGRYKKLCRINYTFWDKYGI